MVPKNVFEALKPIIFALKFFGLSLDKETKISRNIQKAQKLNLACAYCLLLSFFPLMLTSESTYFGRGSSLFNKLVWIAVGISCANRWLFLRQIQLKRLTKQLKQLPLREGSRKAVLDKCLRPFYIFLAMVIIGLLIGILSAGFMLSHLMSLPLLILSAWMDLNMTMIVIFPVFLCYLSGAIPVYCVARVRELGRDVNRACSSIRRAKLVSTLFGQYRQLKRLATMTDSTLAHAMSAVHLMFVLESALYVLLHEEFSDIFNFTNFAFTSLFFMITSSLPAIVYFYPLFQFKLIASSANQMHSQISRALIDSMLMDDEGLSRDPITRPLLLQIRVTQLFDLSHIVLEDASFTCFGQPIADDALFTMFMEAFDMYNTISTANNKETALTRIRLDLSGKFYPY